MPSICGRLFGRKAEVWNKVWTAEEKSIVSKEKNNHHMGINAERMERSNSEEMRRRCQVSSKREADETENLLYFYLNRAHNFLNVNQDSDICG